MNPGGWRGDSVVFGLCAWSPEFKPQHPTQSNMMVRTSNPRIGRGRRITKFKVTLGLHSKFEASLGYRPCLKIKESQSKSQEFYHILVGPRLKRQQHEECKSKASFSHITNPKVIITTVITTLKTKKLQVFDYCPKYCLVVCEILL